jgi:hypothetical protein
MQLIVEIADWDILGNHNVEGGFDKFEITSQPPNSIISQMPTHHKKLLKIVDLFGRETIKKPNSVIFNIYDDGSVEKQFILD